jgi:hypothetical protein
VAVTIDVMDDIKREPRVIEETMTTQPDESREPVTSAAPVARLLANPRRVRRS